LSRAWLWFVFAAHTILALPVVANTIAGGLPPVEMTDPAALRNLDTLFVLDGDNRRGRVRSAAQAASASPGAAVVILGGEDWLLAALTEAGVAPGRISQEYQPADTRQQLAAVQRMTAQTPGRTALVASRLQMARVEGLVRNAGLSCALVASPIDTEPASSGWRLFVPSYYALRVSRDAIYEHAALAYYARKGWIRN
ncbi:MAG TPA: ElyC/SanA/YdcF family protein, partial [Vicinamibacterales bacterium]